MSTEIASAFVRIRPNMSGFKSETESGVKSAFAGIRNTILATVGVIGTFEFAKDVIKDAAQVQKSVEVINAEFGAAGEEVKKFADGAGIALGIAAHTSDQAAARFGLLFNNLGIGKKQAADMTVNLLKLAGSLAAIRGTDPSQVLATLPLALAGNIRGLKQLGFAFTQQQFQAEAFNLHLTQTINQGLTPAQRAVAIYNLVIQKLGQYQAQAAAHSGDLVNVSRRLSAEWDKAKESLGTALLPVLSRFVGFLADRLPGVTAAAGRAFHDLKARIDELVVAISPVTGAFATAIGAIGGVKAAIEGLIAALVVGKIVAFANAIRTDLIANGFTQLRIATEAEKAAYIEAFGAMEIATIGLSATIKSALITTGFGAIIVAIGIVVEEVINHWDTVKRVTIALAEGIAATWGGLKDVLIGTAKVIAAGMTIPLLEPFKLLLQALSFVSGILDVFGIHIGGSVKKAIGLLDTLGTNLLTNGVAQMTKGGTEMANAFSTAFAKGMQGGSGDASKNPAIQAIFAVEKALKDAIANLKAKAQANIEAKISTNRTVIDSTNQAIQNAKEQLAQLKTQLSQLVTQNRIDILNAVRDAKSNLIQIGSTLADQVGQIVDQPFVVAQRKIQDAQDRLALIYDVKNAKLQEQANRLSRLQAQLGLLNDKRSLDLLRNEVALPGGHQLSTDPKKALAQLNALAKGANALNRPAIEGFIIQYRQALLQVSQDKVGLKQSALDARRQAQETRLGIKTDQLQVQQDVADKMKILAQRQINDLVVELSSGAIKIKTFTKKLADVMKREHVSFKTAGALLGTAFATGFQANIAGLTAQALALVAKGAPQRPGSGLEPQIVRPAVTAAKDQLKVLRLQHEIQRKQLAVQTKIQKATEATAKQVALQNSLDTSKSSDAKNPGSASKKTKALSGATG